MSFQKKGPQPRLHPARPQVHPQDEEPHQDSQGAQVGIQMLNIDSFPFFVILGARPLANTIPHGPFCGGGGPLMHLCDLEAGYGGVWAPNFGGAAPGFEPQTSCM